MFNKDKFSELIIKARGSRNNKQYSDESGVSRAYISGYINKSIDNPPTPDVIKRLANCAYADISYEELMTAAGHLDRQINTNESVTTSDLKHKESNLTDKDQKDIEKRVAQLKKDFLENQEGLMLSGDPVSEEAVQSIIDALEFGMRQAKIINKKYTPKKYKKENEDK